MGEGGIERFDLLLDLAKQIANNHRTKSLVIVRTLDSKWLVTLHDLNVTDGNPLPPRGGEDTLEAALKAFVINPPV